MSEEQNIFQLSWSLDADLKAKPAEAQLAEDYSLLSSIAAGEKNPTLRLWCSDPAIVVGTAEKRLPTFQHSVDDLAKKQWQVITRRTGGTAFILTPHILNISAVQLLRSKNLSIDRCYEDFCGLVMLALRDMGVDTRLGFQNRAFCDGKYNILVGNKKLAGTAQRWARSNNQSLTAVLAQASIFVSIDSKEVSQLINEFYRKAGSNKHYDADAIIDLRLALESINPKHNLHKLAADDIQKKLAELIQLRFCSSPTARAQSHLHA